MADSDDRRSVRSPVVLMAAIELAGVRTRVRVSNLSAHGALVIGDQLPAPECEVAFLSNGVTVKSRLVWARDRYAGIQFEDAIDPDCFLRSASLPQTIITRDTRNLDFRRPGFRGNQLNSEEKKVVEDWTSGQRALPRPLPGEHNRAKGNR